MVLVTPGGGYYIQPILKGEGWVEYMYPKPAELKRPEKERIVSKEITYIYRVPGMDIFVGAGVWE